MVQYDYSILGSLTNHSPTSTWLWKISGPLKKCWLRWMESSRLQRVLGFHCLGPKSHNCCHQAEFIQCGSDILQPYQLAMPIWHYYIFTRSLIGNNWNLSAMDWLSWALHISGTCSVSKLIAWGDDIAGGPIIRWSGLTSNCGLWHITFWSRVYPFVTLFANWTNQHSIRQEWLETIHNLTENNIIT